MSNGVRVALLDHFAALKDPRQHAKVLYPLPEIILLVLSATLAGADDFVETVVWGAEHLAFLRRFYGYETNIPSHDTLCDVFAALDPDLFKACSSPGLADCATTTPTSSRSMERHRDAATTGRRAVSLCTSSRPGRRWPRFSR